MSLMQGADVSAAGGAVDIATGELPCADVSTSAIRRAAGQKEPNS